MEMLSNNELIQSYLNYLSSKDFPCVAAREAVARQQVSCMVAGHMACPQDDFSMLEFIYAFVDKYRDEQQMFHSAAVIFRQPVAQNEEMFDNLMWQRLQSLSDLDSQRYHYDSRVALDPDSQKFSFSIKEEAFFIIGLHPQSSRATRQFTHPVLVFNPHDQFEKMRMTRQYEKLKNIVRKRDIAYSGSINPMLDDFGGSSEVYQYSGKQHNNEWVCPLNIKHAPASDHSSPKWSSVSIEEGATP